MTVEAYERARRHGLGHNEALRVTTAVERGEAFACWCGCPTPCVGGAQRFVGCVYSVTPECPEGSYAIGEAA